MNQACHSDMAYHAPLTLLEKSFIWASWGLGGALFLTVGWIAFEPTDPLGPVSVLARRNAVMTLVQAAALAGVVSALATILAGRVRPDIGVFAASLGLAAVSLKGGTTACLLIEGADAAQGYVRVLSLKMALESAGWLVVSVVAILVSGIVTRWYAAEGRGEAIRHDRSRVITVTPVIAAFDIPRLGGLLFGASPKDQTEPRTGIRHTILATGVGLVAMSFFSTGLTSRSIQHGQACFVVAAAVCVACYTAHHFVPVRSALWSIFAVALMSLIGYIWAGFRPVAHGLPVTVVSSPFLRILPIQQIGVGMVAAVAMLWHMRATRGNELAESQQRSGRQSGKGRG